MRSVHRILLFEARLIVTLHNQSLTGLGSAVLAFTLTQANLVTVRWCELRIDYTDVLTVQHRLLQLANHEWPVQRIDIRQQEQ